MTGRTHDACGAIPWELPRMGAVGTHHLASFTQHAAAVPPPWRAPRRRTTPTAAQVGRGSHVGISRQPSGEDRRCRVDLGACCPGSVALIWPGVQCCAQPAAPVRHQGDLTTVRRRDCLGDRESDTFPLDTSTRIGVTFERLHDSLDLGWGYARPLVSDRSRCDPRLPPRRARQRARLVPSERRCAAARLPRAGALRKVGHARELRRELHQEANAPGRGVGPGSCASRWSTGVRSPGVRISSVCCSRSTSADITLSRWARSSAARWMASTAREDDSGSGLSASRRSSAYPTILMTGVRNWGSSNASVGG